MHMSVLGEDGRTRVQLGTSLKTVLLALEDLRC